MIRISRGSRTNIWNISPCDDPLVSQYLIYSSELKIEERLIGNLDLGKHRNIYFFGLKSIQTIYNIYSNITDFTNLIIVELVEDTQEELIIDIEESGFKKMVDDRRVQLVIGDNIFVKKALSKMMNDNIYIYNMANTSIITAPYFKSLFPESTQEIVNWLLERLRTNVSKFGNATIDVLWGLDNYFNNWDVFLKGTNVKAFKNKKLDKPIVIVGAGPSLDKCINRLREIRDYVYIFAVDAAYRPLISNGIIPDVVSTVERTEITLKFYKDQNNIKQTVFLGPNVIKRGILDKFENLIYTGRYGDGYFRDITKHLGFDNLNLGMNVAHVPFAFATYAGVEKIILVGLDLAYPEGKTHTKAVADELEADIKGIYMDNTVKVDGQNGEKLDSFEFFMYAKVWFEDQIAQLDETQVINCSVGGANIIGAVNRNLNDIEFTEINKVNQTFLEWYKDNRTINSQNDKIDYTDLALEHTKNNIQCFDEINSLAEEVVERLSGQKQGRVEFIVNHRMKFDILLASNEAVRFVLQPICIGYYRELHRFPVMLDSQNEEKMVSMTIAFYETILAASKKIVESLDIYCDILLSQKKILTRD